MSKLWQTPGEAELHPLVERFTIGEDRRLDAELLPFDIAGSIGHAASLAAAGILSGEEHAALVGTLESLAGATAGMTELPAGEEDCHSFIERALVEQLGALGEKIHAGRSRNDQVLTALRLYQRDRILKLERALDRLVGAIDTVGVKYRAVEMPGYSHSRRGMVITVGDWLGSYYELFAEDQILADLVLRYLDRSPLGAGAGFGNGLDLDRGVSARALGFSRVQVSPLACMGSRGKDEMLCLHALSQVSVTAAKFAADLLMFSGEQFGFFSLPRHLLTGSSMMPQKTNYDLLELVRAGASVVNGAAATVAGIVTGLGTGYHRDFQMTKGPLIDAFNRTLDAVEIVILTAQNLRVHPDALAAAIDADTRATAEALQLVHAGIPFREAYRQVRAHLITHKESDHE